MTLNASNQPRCPHQVFLRAICEYRKAVIFRVNNDASEMALSLAKDSHERRIEQLMSNLGRAFEDVHQLSVDASDDDASETVNDLFHIGQAMADVLDYFGVQPRKMPQPNMNVDIIAERIGGTEVLV